MRTFCHTLIATILGITPLTGFAQVPGPGGQAVVLARVDLAGPPQSYGLPVHAFLQDGAGQEYLLVLNSEGNLRLAGWPYRVLDASAAEPEAYLLAAAKRPGAREAAGTRFRVVLDDGAQWIVRATAEEAEELADLGFALQRLTRAPITWSKPPARVARQA